ncbi:MAG: transposase [Deltaproteobacteria bacterium]|nr:transposase [Deltaproteobacteria bacterium]
MARPLRIQYPGAVYHITHRGNERKVIFRNDADRNEFLTLLAQSKETYDAILHSYVLMSNHFHLLVETPRGNLSEFMRHFNITYTSYFNRHYKRSGNLYQGRFKSFLIDKENYLSRVSRYIHLNPVKIKSMKSETFEEQLRYLFNYKWSSLPGFAVLNKRDDFVEYDYVLEEFGGDTRLGRTSYKKEIAADMQVGLPLEEQVVGQSILGGDDFVSWVKEKYLHDKKNREQPSVGKIHRLSAVEDILLVLEEISNTSAKEIISEPGLLRQMAMDMLYRHGGLTNPEIGKLMGLDYSTVSVGRKRLHEKVSRDKKSKQLWGRINKKCQG